MIIRLIFVFILFSAISCRKVLDLSPENSLTYRNALVTPDDFEAALRGAGQFLLYEVRDNHIAQPLKGEYADQCDAGFLRERLLAPDFIREGSWSNHYKIIAQANVVLKYLEDASFDEQWKNNYRGQAYFYKSLAYFELIRQFGDCILVTEELKVEAQAKTPWHRVADYAIGLAEQAALLLPEYSSITNYRGTATPNKSAPSRGAAHALLAHLCAWKAGCKYFAGDVVYDENHLWQKAEAAASAVITSGQYQLAANPEQVSQTVLTGNSVENIYETVFRNLWHEMDASLHSFPFLVANYYQAWPVKPGSTPADRAVLRIRDTSVNAMYQGNDQRKHAWFHKFDEMAHPDNYMLTDGFAYPHKYREIVVATSGWFSGQMLNFNVNKTWWRLADIILLRAECRSRMGDQAGAIADLNQVRFRSQANAYHPSEYRGDLQYVIFKEREKELLMEGHRYYDVIRNGYAYKELEEGFRNASVQDFIDGAFFLAISTSENPDEFKNNPLLTQNTYWARFL